MNYESIWEYDLDIWRFCVMHVFPLRPFNRHTVVAHKILVVSLSPKLDFHFLDLI